MHLARANLAQLRNRRFKNIIVPAGATEQHGPYLPYSTDLVVAEHLAAALDSDDVLILPAIPYSCSQEHQGFPGSVWIDYKLFMSYLEAICTSVQDLSPSIMLLSGHGGNTEVFELFRIDWNYKHEQTKVTILEAFTEEVQAIESKLLDGKVDSHAGNGEISIMLYLQPDLVTIPPTNVKKESYVSVFGKDRVSRFYKDGILDRNPAWKVSAEIGEQLFKAMISALRAQL
jgi:creatinine amidohydrolase/Fe(II)-dependent formamide hydrolase-like protein